MAAEWMSKQCGDQRIEELKESYPASWSGANGNRTVSTEIKDRRLFIPSEFMGMRDLRGILRHGNSLVRIELPYVAKVQRAEAFLPKLNRPMLLAEQGKLEFAVPEPDTSAEECAESERTTVLELNDGGVHLEF
jgi:type IV secretory pathway TraG/TraD family ATPase VirD4